ncbi:F-box/LRR-repeat protein [Carex littledalei]|uniref:F-box/LRR-repeat protein n=1 Tax=Carex littledalei TaxID=544730 RepID=A0A833QSY9_9POAL|nr:F-box/LRR-repeat protein [Carex littledalei]
MNRIDRLSNLPDTILHHILSLLSTREAGRTCVLAKRWVNLWASLPSLVLDSKGNESNFEHFVNRVFRLRESLSVVSSILPLALPGSIFRCESLEELMLDVPYPGIEPIPDLRPKSISLSRLRRLDINAVVTLYDDFMVKLMSGCALLEELSLRLCKLEFSVIPSDVLKRLLIGSCDHSDMIYIHTPNLLCLELYGALLGGYTFKDMVLWSRQRLNFKVSWMNMIISGAIPGTMPMCSEPFQMLRILNCMERWCR